MKPYLFHSLFLAAICAASAQQAAPSKTEYPPLPEPILHRVTDLTPWKIVFRSLQQNPPPQSGASQAKTTSIVKSGNVYHIVESQPNGATLDKWSIDGMLVKFPPNTDRWSISNTDLNFSKTDFPELPWISKENYTGVQKVNGKDAYLFKAQYTIIDENGQPEIVTQTAAIDVATQWPLYSTDGASAVLYQYGSPGTTPLTIPPKVSAAIAKQREFARPSRNP